jgi:hypothetical protein
MTDLELLECTQSLYDFLIDDNDIEKNKSFNSFMEIPSFKKMNETLVKYEFVHGQKNMVLFTLTLNDVYKIYDQNDFRQLLRNRPKDFFSSKECHNFFKTILRQLKVNLTLI